MMRKQKSCAQLQSQHSDVTKRNSTTHVLSGSEATVSLCDVQMERSGTFAFTLTHSPRCFIVSVCFNGWLQYSQRTNWRIDHAKYSKSHYIVQPKRKEKRIFFVFTFTIFCLHPIFVFNFNLNYSGVFFSVPFVALVLAQEKFAFNLTFDWKISYWKSDEYTIRFWIIWNILKLTSERKKEHTHFFVIGVSTYKSIIQSASVTMDLMWENVKREKCLRTHWKSRRNCDFCLLDHLSVRVFINPRTRHFHPFSCEIYHF